MLAPSWPTLRSRLCGRVIPRLTAACARHGAAMQPSWQSVFARPPMPARLFPQKPGSATDPEGPAATKTKKRSRRAPSMTLPRQCRRTDPKGDLISQPKAQKRRIRINLSTNVRAGCFAKSAVAPKKGLRQDPKASDKRRHSTRAFVGCKDCGLPTHHGRSRSARKHH